MPKDGGYKYRRDKLLKAGLLSWEARELARNYNMEQLRSFPYLQSIIKSRRLTISNYRRKGLSDKTIVKKIHDLYLRKGFVTDGKPNIWSLIRSHRRDIIAKGGDASPGVAPKRGTHHPKDSGISKGNLVEQRKKRSHHKSKSFGRQYEDKQGR
jgi:hypothetical protein